MGQSTKRTWRFYLGQTIGVGLIFGLLFILILPAIRSAIDASNRRYREGNLRGIAVAMHRAYEQKIILSQAITRPNGRPLLSWRVALLPFLEDPAANNLYKQFKLDEPWDSPHNYALLAKMPAVYQSAGRNLPANHTLMKVFVTAPSYEKGKYRSFWPTSGPNHLEELFLKKADAIDYTILAAEIGSPVPWTKPEDILIDEALEDDRTDLDFITSMSSRYGSSMAFHAVMADGSVKTLRRPYQTQKTNKQVIRAFIGYKDGETVDSDAVY